MTSGAHAPGDSVGTLGEEAVKLLSAMSTCAQDHADPTGARSRSEPSVDETGARCGPEASCRWCPLCQALAAARSAGPQLREQLIASGLALTMAARAFLETLAASPASGPAARPDVEHIDLSDDGGAQPWD